LKSSDLLGDNSTGRTYRLLKAIAGTNSLSTLIDGVDYRELTSTVFDDQLRDLGSMAFTDIDKFPQLAQYNLFTDSLSVPNVAFNATTWNGSYSVFTKNAFRDEIIRYRLLSDHDSLSTLQERSYTSLTDKPDLSGYATTTQLGTKLDTVQAPYLTRIHWPVSYDERNHWDGGTGDWFNATNGRSALGLGDMALETKSRYRLQTDHDSLSTLDEKSYNSLDNKPDLTILAPKDT
jgi:hypothetical protein